MFRMWFRAVCPGAQQTRRMMLPWACSCVNVYYAAIWSCIYKWSKNLSSCETLTECWGSRFKRSLMFCGMFHITQSLCSENYLGLFYLIVLYLFNMLCMHVYMCLMFVYVCMYVCMYMHVYVCVCGCMYVYVHICMYVYVCVYIYIYWHYVYHKLLLI